jgi:hypothetical protein
VCTKTLLLLLFMCIIVDSTVKKSCLVYKFAEAVFLVVCDPSKNKLSAT